jgi:hypothetical protein
MSEVWLCQLSKPEMRLVAATANHTLFKTIVPKLVVENSGIPVIDTQTGRRPV